MERKFQEKAGIATASDVRNRPKTLFFSVGEPSGDQHAARLIQELRRHDSTLSFRGFGGPAMEEQGCRIEHDLTRMAVVGLLEVLPKLREFFALADKAEEVFRSGAVDGVLLVDFPGFNWHIAKRAKRYGLPVYYYLPPQLWAWGGWRVRKLRRNVDHVLSVLRLENKWFDEHQVANTYVGHPFFDSVTERVLDAKTTELLDQARIRGERLVAVLPGSRDHEVRRNFPLMIEAMKRISLRNPRVRFLVGAYRDAHAMWCRDLLNDPDGTLPVQIFVNRTSEVIEYSECAMMVSGSVSLELLARGKPAAVVYRVGRLLNAYARMLIKVKSITLVNLMAGRTLFPEMVSVGSPTPAIDFLEHTMNAMLEDRYYYDSIVEQLHELRVSEGGPGGTARAAEVLLRKLGWPEGHCTRFEIEKRFPIPHAA